MYSLRAQGMGGVVTRTESIKRCVHVMVSGEWESYPGVILTRALSCSCCRVHSGCPASPGSVTLLCVAVA